MPEIIKIEDIDINNIFGNNLLYYRKLRKYTQEELAEKLEITQKHLSIIENGRQFVSSALLTKIIKVLKVHPAALFFYDIPDFTNENSLGKIYKYIDQELKDTADKIKLYINNINNY